MRAIRILKEADLVLAEDTRTSSVLLKHFDIKNRLVAHHKFNEHGTSSAIVERLKGGETIALISDAGTPGISDPGFYLAREAAKAGITVQGIDDVSVRFAKCCSPIPGDEIVGFVTRGRGITIHRTDCVNVLNMSEMDRSRLIEAEWQPTDNKGSEKYMAEIQVYANNRTGLLVDLSKNLYREKD